MTAPAASADELGAAVRRYLAPQGRRFPLLTEVLAVARSLGYRKVAAPQRPPRYHPMDDPFAGDEPAAPDPGPVGGRPDRPVRLAVEGGRGVTVCEVLGPYTPGMDRYGADARLDEAIGLARHE